MRLVAVRLAELDGNEDLDWPFWLHSKRDFETEVTKVFQYKLKQLEKELLEICA